MERDDVHILLHAASILRCWAKENPGRANRFNGLARSVSDVALGNDTAAATVVLLKCRKIDGVIAGLAPNVG